MTAPLLDVHGLVTEFRDEEGTVTAVDGMDFAVTAGETLGIVGESGAGKTTAILSVLGLLPRPAGRVVAGQAHFRGQDLLALPDRQLRRVRGAGIGLVFQDPTTALNPVLTIGDQITEAIRAHQPLGAAQARERAAALLTRVGIADAGHRLRQYPHQLSGGLRQRVVIAMAISNEPDLLIADEPTSSLDTTIQAQILEVLEQAQRDTATATILVTHDLGLVAETADRMLVMYAGRVVESGAVPDVFAAPRHPYTRGLLRSLPTVEEARERLEPIPGSPPSLHDRPPGCAFHPRCHLARGRARCHQEVPVLEEVGEGRRSACHFHAELMAAEPPR